MADGKYTTESDDYSLDCEDSEVFNNELLPFLKKLNIEENNIETIVKMVDEIYSEGYSDGYSNCKHIYNGNFW